MQRALSDRTKAHRFLKLFRTFTGKMTRGLSLRMVFSLLFQDTLFYARSVLIKKSKFLKAKHRTKIWKIEIPRSMVVESLD